MFQLNTLVFLFIFSRPVSSGLVPRQLELMPLCGRECTQSAPLGICTDTDWNCLCRTDSFMLSSVSCISGHCSRLGMVDKSLRALEGQCKANSVDVALSPSPLDGPRPPQTTTFSVVFPQSTDRSSSPALTSTSPSPTPTPPRDPIQASNNLITTSIDASIPIDPATTRPSSTAPTSSDTGGQSSIRATSNPDPTTTASGSTNFIGPNLNASSNPTENRNFSSAVPIIAGVASGAAVFILALVAFFLLYIRRLKRERYCTDQLDTRKIISSASDILPQTQWGHSPLSSFSQRPTTPSSQHTTPSSARIDQFSLLPPCNPIVRKDRSGSSPTPLASRYDSSNLSDIYVQHQDSGLLITPPNYGVVELPPEYYNRNDSTC